MNINQYQKEVNNLFDEISKKKNRKPTKEEVFIHLIEEIGELAKQIINEKIRKEKFSLENLKEEIADSILFLTYLASQYNLDLEETLRKDTEKLKKRFNLR